VTRNGMMLALAMTLTAAFWLATCAGCSDSSLPEGYRLPSDAELRAADDVRARWEARDALPALDAECQAYYGRLRVVDADRNAMLDLCWRDEPGQCQADASESRYGCAASCALVRSRSEWVGSPWWDSTPYPVAVVSDLLRESVSLVALRHEATHLLTLGPCPPVTGAYDHSNPALWGAEGVHPL
jgi:hypothetical protein